jgi:hypothetical protein
MVLGKREWRERYRDGKQPDSELRDSYHWHKRDCCSASIASHCCVGRWAAQAPRWGQNLNGAG